MSVEKDSKAGSRASLAGKYLSFALSAERYGVPILMVQEIIGVPHVTVVPRASHYLKGVINLRGKIIPIVDLRLKFNMEPIPYNEKTCVIVVDTIIGDKAMPLGVIVDTVLEVSSLEASQIEPPPAYGSMLSTDFIMGMGRVEGSGVTILLDLNKALSGTPLVTEESSEAGAHAPEASSAT